MSDYVFKFSLKLWVPYVGPTGRRRHFISYVAECHWQYGVPMV